MRQPEHSSSSVRARSADFPLWRYRHVFLAIFVLLMLATVVHARTFDGGGRGLQVSVDASLRSLGQQVTQANYEFIEGVKAFKDKDFYRAERIWLPLARAGYSKAQFFLGVLYESASNDRHKAVYWYSKAAQQGNSDAQYNLGLAYARGLGVKKNIAEAIHWWRESGLKGNSDSQYNLGIVYATGASGVHQDFREAKRWWLLAAANGDALAQYNLGAMYANGVAGKQSYCEAIRWWSKSQSNGFHQADIALQNLGKRLNNLNCH